MPGRPSRQQQGGPSRCSRQAACRPRTARELMAQLPHRRKPKLPNRPPPPPPPPPPPSQLALRRPAGSDRRQGQDMPGVEHRPGLQNAPPADFGLLARRNNVTAQPRCFVAAGNPKSTLIMSPDSPLPPPCCCAAGAAPPATAECSASEHSAASVPGPSPRASSLQRSPSAASCFCCSSSRCCRSAAELASSALPLQEQAPCMHGSAPRRVASRRLSSLQGANWGRLGPMGGVRDPEWELSARRVFSGCLAAAHAPSRPGRAPGLRLTSAGLPARPAPAGAPLAPPAQPALHRPARRCGAARRAAPP